MSLRPLSIFRGGIHILPAFGDFTLQGVVEDAGSPNGRGFSVTNAVIVRFPYRIARRIAR